MAWLRACSFDTLLPQNMPALQGQTCLKHPTKTTSRLKARTYWACDLFASRTQTPASINSFLTRHKVVLERQPRLCTIDHATVKLPLLSPRYCPASSKSNLQAWGLSAINARDSNTLRTMPTNGSEYLVPLCFERLTVYTSAISGTASSCSFNCVGFLGFAFGAGGTGWPPVLSNT
jgi:hypothetical protein